MGGTSSTPPFVTSTPPQLAACISLLYSVNGFNSVLTKYSTSWQRKNISEGRLPIKANTYELTYEDYL